MKFLKIFATAAVFTVSTISTLDAIPIVGGVAFVGSLSVNQGPSTTTVNFDNPFFTIGGTGDFSGIGFASVQFTDFAFTTATSTLTAPVAPLWTIGSAGFSFDLLSLSSALVTDDVIILGGQGIGKSTDPSLDDTSGSWGLIAVGNSFEFKFALSGSAVHGGGGSSVPDGGTTLTLLGVALFGLAVVRRRFV